MKNEKEKKKKQKIKLEKASRKRARFEKDNAEWLSSSFQVPEFVLEEIENIEEIE